MKFPFSNTLEGRAARGSPFLAAFLEEQPKQQIILTEEITPAMYFKKDFSGVDKMLLLSNPYILYYQQNIILSRYY
ncbi:TPA: hypothetical protein ACIJW7_004856 [Klebsiella pneumoniae]